MALAIPMLPNRMWRGSRAANPQHPACSGGCQMQALRLGVAGVSDAPAWADALARRFGFRLTRMADEALRQASLVNPSGRELALSRLHALRALLLCWLLQCLAQGGDGCVDLSDI